MFGIDDAIAAGSNLISTVVSRIWPDATEAEKDKLTMALQEMNNQYAVILAQIDLNKTEAGSAGMLGKWRSGLGWTLTIAVGYEWVLKPILEFIALTVFSYAGHFPEIDTATLFQILVAMLGIGTVHSITDSHLPTAIDAYKTKGKS
jgi:hypothetical protein